MDAFDPIHQSPLPTADMAQGGSSGSVQLDTPDDASSHETKKSELSRACIHGQVERLQQLAVTEGGLLDDAFRRTAWPLLLGCSATFSEDQAQYDRLTPHPDEDQVRLDVERSFVYYPRDESDTKKDSRKEALSSVIVTVLRRFRMLHYFQGYHDIVQVLSLVLGSGASIEAVSRLSLLRIRDFMLPTMSGTVPHLQLLPVILYAADPTLASHLSQTQPFFALPATLTLYAHEIEEYGQIARLFDFLLATEAVMSIYLFAVVVISRRDQLLGIESDEPEMLHATLSKLPKPLDIDHLVQKAVDLFNHHPPEKLPGVAWWRVSSNSVLKTTRNLGSLQNQTLADGIRFFQKEATEIRRKDALLQAQKQMRGMFLRYRRPVTWTGAAVAFALLALLLRSDAAVSYASFLSPLSSQMYRLVVDVWRRIVS